MQAENIRNLFKLEHAKLSPAQLVKHFPSYDQSKDVEITSNFQQDAAKVTCWYTGISTPLTIISTTDESGDDVVDYDIPAGVGDIYSDFHFAITLPAIKVKSSSVNDIKIKWSKIITPCIIKDVKLMIGDDSELSYDGFSQIIETNYNTLPQYEAANKESLGVNAGCHDYETSILGDRIVYKLPGLNNRGDIEFKGLSRFRIPDRRRVSMRVTYNLNLTSLIHTIARDHDTDTWSKADTNLSLLMCSRPKISRPILSAHVKSISAEEKKNLLCFGQKYSLLYNHLESVTKTEVRVKLGEVARIDLQIPLEAEVKSLFIVATDDTSPDVYALGHISRDNEIVDCIAHAKLEIKTGKNFVTKAEFGPGESIIEASHYIRLPFLKGIRSLPLCLRPFGEDGGVPLDNHEFRLTVQLGDYRNCKRQVEESGKKSLDNWMWIDENPDNLYQLRVYALYERRAEIGEEEEDE